MQLQFRKSTHNALYNESLAQEFLPDLSIGIIATRKAVWQCRWGVWRLEEIHKEKVQSGQKLRKLQKVFLEESSHFVSLLRLRMFELIFSDAILWHLGTLWAAPRVHECFEDLARISIELPDIVLVAYKPA